MRRRCRRAAAPGTRWRGVSGILPFKCPPCSRPRRRWSDEELERALRALGKADRRLKRSVAGVALGAAIAAACGEPGVRARGGPV